MVKSDNHGRHSIARHRQTPKWPFWTSFWPHFWPFLTVLDPLEAKNIGFELIGPKKTQKVDFLWLLKTWKFLGNKELHIFHPQLFRWRIRHIGDLWWFFQTPKWLKNFYKIFDFDPKKPTFELISQLVASPDTSVFGFESGHFSLILACFWPLLGHFERPLDPTRVNLQGFGLSEFDLSKVKFGGLQGVCPWAR